jgi:hypothetical protein
LLELDLPVSFQGLLRVGIAGATGPRNLHPKTVQLSLHALGLGRRVRQGPQADHLGAGLTPAVASHGPDQYPPGLDYEAIHQGPCRQGLSACHP